MSANDDPRKLAWRINANNRAKAKADAERAAIRERRASYEPKDVRTYGEPWDSMIAAAAESSVPRPESPNKGSVKR